MYVVCVYGVCVYVSTNGWYTYGKKCHHSSLIWPNALKQCSTWLLAYPGACRPVSALLCWGFSEALQLVKGNENCLLRGAECSRGAETISLPPLSGALLPPPPQPVCPIACLPHDRGAGRAAGVRDTCQQGYRVSSESVPCLSLCHVDWQPASADYRHCGSKRSSLWQWQAYDLQDVLILSNQHIIRRLRLCYPSLENTLPGRYSDTLAICLRLKDQIVTMAVNCICYAHKMFMCLYSIIELYCFLDAQSRKINWILIIYSIQKHV